MANNLEEYYKSILGNPEEGNVAELEKKFKRKSAEYLITKSDDRVDISLIQKSGELTSAYLYLKAKWELEAKDKPFVPRILRIEHPKEIKPTTLEIIHRKLYSLAMTGMVAIGIYSVIQLGLSFFDESLSTAFRYKSDTENLREMIVEEEKVQGEIKKNALKKFKESRKEFTNKVGANSLLPLHVSAKSCDLKQLEKAIQEGQNLNQRDKDGATALHWSSRINCIKGTQLLLNAGARTDIIDKAGKSPLDWAKNNNNFESIRILDKR